MDAIRLHMHGHRETVASLGTSLTEEQALLLKRFSDKCYICYDSDTAGQNATLRGMYILQRAGLQVFVVLFPGGKDPDEMLQSEGGEQLFNEAVENARPLVLHHIGLFKAAAEKDGQAKAAEELLEGMAQLTAVELAPYMQEIAHAVGLPDYQLASELNRLRRGRRLSPRAEESLAGDVQPLELETADSETPPNCDPAETGLLYLLWISRELRMSASVAEVVRMFQDPRLKDCLLYTSPSPRDTR